MWPGAGVAWARTQKQVACDPGRRRPRPRGLGLRGLGCMLALARPGSRAWARVAWVAGELFLGFFFFFFKFLFLLLVVFFVRIAVVTVVLLVVMVVFFVRIAVVVVVLLVVELRRCKGKIFFFFFFAVNLNRVLETRFTSRCHVKKMPT